MLLEQFEDPTLKALIVAATLTLVAGLFSTDNFAWISGVSIYAAVLFIALFASGINYVKEK